MIDLLFKRRKSLLIQTLLYENIIEKILQEIHINYSDKWLDLHSYLRINDPKQMNI